MLALRQRASSWRAAMVLAFSITICFIPRIAAAGILDEVWIGGFAHDISDRHGKESGTTDVEVEVDSARPALLRVLGAPRITLTYAANTEGKTSFGGAGLIWDHRLIGPLSGSLQFGIDQTNGITRPAAGAAGAYDRDHRLLLGSKTLFREAVGLNWTLSERWLIGAEYIHLSNGMILAHRYNEGINDAGMRLGYRFR